MKHTLILTLNLFQLSQLSFNFYWWKLSRGSWSGICSLFAAIGSRRTAARLLIRISRHSPNSSWGFRIVFNYKSRFKLCRIWVSATYLIIVLWPWLSWLSWRGFVGGSSRGWGCRGRSLKIGIGCAQSCLFFFDTSIYLSFKSLLNSSANLSARLRSIFKEWTYLEHSFHIWWVEGVFTFLDN